MIQNPGFLPDHPQNLITCSLCHARHTLKISERSVHNFLSYLANTHTHTHRQTDKNRQKHNLLGGGNNLQSLLTYLQNANIWSYNLLQRNELVFLLNWLVEILRLYVAGLCTVSRVHSKLEGQNSRTFRDLKLQFSSIKIIDKKT